MKSESVNNLAAKIARQNDVKKNCCIMRFFSKPRNQIDVFELRAFIISEADEDYFCLQIELLINNQIGVGVPVDLSELKKAVGSNGSYFIWTCDCGEPGCAGRFKGIHFENSGEFTTFKDLDCQGSDEFKFESKAIISAFELVLKNGRKLAKGFPGKNLVSIPDQNRAFFDTSSVLEM